MLYELAKNMDIQQRARNEILKVLEKYDGILSYESMMEMGYIDQIINGKSLQYAFLLKVVGIVTLK